MAANTAWHDDELAYLMDHGIAGYMERYPGYRSYDAVRVKHGVLRKGMGGGFGGPLAAYRIWYTPTLRSRHGVYGAG